MKPMTSYIMQLGFFQQFPPIGQYSISGKPKNSYFGKIADLVKEIKKDVNTHCDKLSESDREALKRVAERIFNPAKVNNSSPKTPWKCLLRSWIIRLHLIVAIVNGQFEVVEAYIGVIKLADAIMEAVEREEAGITALFLDQIMEDAHEYPSKLVLFTKKMDEKLEDLLNGVELD